MPPKQNLINVHQIFARCWVVFKHQYKKFIIIPIITIVLLGIVGYCTIAAIDKSVPESNSFLHALINPGQPALYVIIVALILAIIIQFFGVISIVATAIKNGQVVTSGDLLRACVNLFWKFIGLVILISLINILILFLAYIPTILLGIIIYFIHSANFDSVFSILGIIPAIASLVYIFWFTFSGFLLVEGKGVVESLKESKKLLKGRWFSIFWRMIIILVITTILAYVLSLVPYAGPALAVFIFIPVNIIYAFVIFEDLKAKGLVKNEPGNLK